jgi:hypothetical protein
MNLPRQKKRNDELSAEQKAKFIFQHDVGLSQAVMTRSLQNWY